MDTVKKKGFRVLEIVKKSNKQHHFLMFWLDEY
jgi:hypothetical protein